MSEIDKLNLYMQKLYNLQSLVATLTHTRNEVFTLAQKSQRMVDQIYKIDSNIDILLDKIHKALEAYPDVK